MLLTDNGDGRKREQTFGGDYRDISVSISFMFFWKLSTDVRFVVCYGRSIRQRNRYIGGIHGSYHRWVARLRVEQLRGASAWTKITRR